MTEPAAGPLQRRAVAALATVLLAAMAIRLAASVAAGIADLVDSADKGFPTSKFEVAQSLILFGSAGDGAGVVLTLLAAGLVWWLLRVGDPAERLRLATGAVFVVLLVSAVITAVGYVLFATSPDDVLWSSLFRSTGDSLAYALVAAGGLVATSRLGRIGDDLDHAVGDDDPFVFVVDRKSGDVNAYFSVDAAARRTHVYLVEDNEVEFFTDDGTVLAAAIEHDRVTLRPTDDNRHAELLDRLGQFVVRRDIAVDMLDVDDAAAYALPISNWQWLQLWPGWLRWMGRIFRPK